MSWPKQKTAEKGGYKLTINCYGSYLCDSGGWPSGGYPILLYPVEHHHAGDPKGSVTLEVYGLKLRVGNPLFPQCLDSPRFSIKKLKRKAESKSVKLNEKLLNKLADEAWGGDLENSYFSAVCHSF